jgi:hypothetical protein
MPPSSIEVRLRLNGAPPARTPCSSRKAQAASNWLEGKLLHDSLANWTRRMSS